MKELSSYLWVRLETLIIVDKIGSNSVQLISHVKRIISLSHFRIGLA
jgi:hypothetical protein